MAEGWSDSVLLQSGFSMPTIPCKFFKLGGCIYGSSCRFAHEGEGSSVPASATNGIKPGVARNRNVSEVLGNISRNHAEEPQSKMTVLHKSRSSNSKISTPDVQPNTASGPNTSAKPVQGLSQSVPADTWVNAPEFVPSYSYIAGDAVSQASVESLGEESVTWAKIVDPGAGQAPPHSSSELCPYFMVGLCRYGEQCVYIHGLSCDLCGQACLHPNDKAQQDKHKEECIKHLEADMEESFAVARSKEKMCGICMEVVWEKSPAGKQRFGILPNCPHCFCLDCIRKWRQAKQFENKIIRSCPECRVQSDFVCPSRYWYDVKEEKSKMLEDYKKNLGKKPCKYFSQGRGQCPFGNKCFYLHAYPDGTHADVGPPQTKHRQAADGDVEVIEFLLWDFLEDRNNRENRLLMLDNEDFLYFFPSDSEDSYYDDD